MELDLVVRGGLVVSPGVSGPTDVGIKDGRIAALGDLSAATAGETLDGTGLHVFPGGVDPHTHINWPFLKARTRDDFAQASKAALFGGTTSIVDWARPVDGSAARGVQVRRGEAESQQVALDFTLHCILSPDLDFALDEVPGLVQRGTPTFKCYMTYRKRGLLIDDANLFKALRRVAAEGGIVGVHAENPALHEAAEVDLRREGSTDPIHFRQAKGSLVESEAIHRAIYLAEAAGAPLLIQHVSTGDGIDLIRQAQRKGLPVFAETCPQYLILTDEVYLRPDGRNFICSPPIKSEEDRERLWEAVEDGTVNFIGTDHGAFSLEDKSIGDTSFDVPNGLPGIETRIPLIYSEGVVKGRISPGRFAQLIAENAARMNGIYPQKGSISVGSDADLVLIDPSATRVLDATTLHQPIDWTPYAGIEVKGYPTVTILRGDVVVRGNDFTPPTTKGRFLQGLPHLFRTIR